MRPKNRLFLFALIIFLLFGTVPTVFAVEPTAEDFANAFIATCDDPPISQYGEITTSSQIDYYAVDLVAGQFFTIDVDAEKIESSLDSILEVFDASGELVAVSVESTEVPAADPAFSASGMDISPDPYLEMTVDVGGTYYLAISAETPGAGADTGFYTLLLTCSYQPPPPEFKWPVAIGDLLGATGSNPGSFVIINPENAESSLPFDMGVGPIADIEYQYSTHTLLVAIDDNPGSIIAIDSVTGDKVQTFNLAPETGTIPTVVALEATENMLYGVQVDPSSEYSTLVQVTFDESDPTNPKATLAPVFLFGKQQVRDLAYHSVEKVIYGVASIASTSDLIKIYLEPELLVDTTSAIPIVDETTGEPINVVSLDFSNENFLIGIDLLGNLYEIDHTNGQAVSIGEPMAKVSSLTFVVGEPPDDDPIKTICSSTLTSSASTSSETAAPKLSRFKLKKNPLHRAIGLFKFEGIKDETVTINIKAEEEESAEAVVEASSVNELENPWLNYWKGKGRVFLGIRDSIPGLDFRARKKDQLPLTLSATLPADGTYYVMVIRPLLRFYQTDYCVTLESNIDASQAWKTFDVAWPNDESGNDTALTSAEELEEDGLNNTETLAGASEDDDLVPVALSTTTIAPTTAPPPEEITEEETGDVPTAAVSTAENPRDPVDVVDESDSEGVPTDAGDTTVEETVKVTSEEPAGGGDTAVVQTVGDEPTVVEPIAETPVVPEPAADSGGDTAVVQTVGDETPVVEPLAETPVVPELTADGGDTTVDEPAIVTVDEPVVETPVPTAVEGGGTESGDDTAVDEYSDDPMEDPLPMKG